MNKILNTISYYILILLGLIATSWIIWSRFLRERVIRDVPDMLLTEYRVWILVYICCIYIFAIKNLIKETHSNIFFEQISKYFWKPLITLDYVLKYNKFYDIYYHKFVIYIMIMWNNLSISVHSIIIICFQVLPRIILVIILLIDVFYNKKIEIFYKFVLIGLLPFIFKYIEYSFKDFCEYLIKKLLDNYDKVQIFEKGYSFDISRVNNTDAVWHNDFVPVEKYIEIIYETPFDCIKENTSYEYVGSPYCKDDIYKKYKKQFNKSISDWTIEEHQKTEELFHELMPQIINLKLTIDNFQSLKKEKKIRWLKTCIFGGYLICWSYVLIISYYYCPVELMRFKNLLINIIQYLIIEENPFINNMCSINQNLITVDNIKNFIKTISNNLIK